MASIQAASIIAAHLTDLLNQKINVLEVHDEMFLIELGQKGKNKSLSKMVAQIMKDNMTPANKSSEEKLQRRVKQD